MDDVPPGRPGIAGPKGGLPLGLVGLKGGLGHLKGTFPAVACEGRFHVQLHLAHAGGEVLIDLLHGPDPVLLRRLGIVGGVRRQGHGVVGGLGGQDMLPVAVLPVLPVLGHHHQRFDPSIEPHQLPRHVLLPASLSLLLRGPLVDVREAQKEGMGPDAPQPQAVDALLGPFPAGQRHIDHGAGIAPLPAVDGVHAPQEHPFVVRMGGHQQKIRPVNGRRRVGRTIRHGSGAEDGGLHEPEGLPQGQDLHHAAPRGQGDGQGDGVGLHLPDPQGQPQMIPLQKHEGGAEPGEPQHQRA